MGAFVFSPPLKSLRAGEVVPAASDVTLAVPDSNLHVGVAGDAHDASSNLAVVASTVRRARGWTPSLAESPCAVQVCPWLAC